MFTAPAVRYLVGSLPTAPCLPSAANHPFYPQAGFSISEKPGSHLGQANGMGSREPLFFFGFLRSGEICCPTTTQFDQTCHPMPLDLTVRGQPHQSNVTVSMYEGLENRPILAGCYPGAECHSAGFVPPRSHPTLCGSKGCSTGPLFQMANGDFLTRERFVKEVRSLPQLAELDLEPYSGHSFRIGAATTAAQAGLEGQLIQMLGRWLNSAYLSYIRLPGSP